MARNEHVYYQLRDSYDLADFRTRPSYVRQTSTSLNEATPGRESLDNVSLLGSTCFKGTELHLEETSSHDDQKPEWYKGWRFGVKCASGVAAFVCITNVFLTAWSWSQYPVVNGIGSAYTGRCQLVEKLSIVSHLAINALSSALLGASTYCMQCVYSPSRSEVDAAHAKNDWLEIGTSGFRNLKRIPPLRSLIWFALAGTSLPFHLLYNSALFKVQEYSTYDLYFASDQALNGVYIPNPWSATLNASSSPSTLDLVKTGLEPLTRNESWECMDFAQGSTRNPVVIGNPVVIVITNDTLPWNMEYQQITILDAHRNVTMDYFAEQLRSWRLNACYSMKDDLYGRDFHANASECVEMNKNSLNDRYGWGSLNYPNDIYCLSPPQSERCELQVSIYILMVLAVFAAAKAAIMIAVLFIQRAPLVTLGDAIASFLTTPDPNTVGMCLMTKDDPSWLKQREALQPRMWKPGARLPLRRAGIDQLRQLIWYRAHVGFGVISLILWIAALTTVTDTDATHLIKTPFTDNALGALITATLVNAPQVLLSFLYVSTNNLVGCMSLCSEWSNFGLKRRGLRVSMPVGEQRSTYWLQLPFRFSVPLLVMGILHHWMLSQSCYLVRVAYYLEGAQQPTYGTFVGWGNPFGTIFCIMNVIVFGFVYAVGTRPLTSHMPIAGSCSAAISAACHRPDQDTSTAIKLVKWGSISVTDRTGTERYHCCFTSFEVEELVEGKEYA